MGKVTGFMEFERETAKYISPLDRIKDYCEFTNKVGEETLKNQGARCMDCGIPFCHTGTNTEFGLIGCPLSNLIPEFNDLVYKGDYDKAFERLSITNCFPEFTGKVCPAPCEGSCTLGMIKPAVTIKSIENSIITKMFEEDKVKANIPKEKINKKVAIIGSGPSGLAAAHTLIGLGVGVTVYERANRAGGLLMYGIPNMKLDKTIVL
ncbi:MAG: NAD(P)-binding protein, partial [Lachnospirales bacterium]